MHAQTTIRIGIAMALAGVAAWAGLSAARAQSLPDLTVSIKVEPNPVPIGMGYEVQITVSNTEPPRPATIRNPDAPAVPTAPPDVSAPDVIPSRPGPVEGADVPEAELILGSTVKSGRIAVQTNPPLSIRDCYALGIDSPEERCTIGPLKKGGSWTITLVYRSPVPPGTTFPYTIGYWATIDDRNKIKERQEDNNAAGTTVSFQ
jgi:hypothetical protein